MAQSFSIFCLDKIFFRCHNASKNTEFRKLLSRSNLTLGSSSGSAIGTMRFPSIFRECTEKRVENVGKQAHARMIASGFTPVLFVSNCLIQMYVRCANLGYAHKLLDRMDVRDVVSWNSLVFGYAGSGDMDKARVLFESMPERDVVSWNSMISGYLQSGESLKCIRVFVEMGRLRVGFDNKSVAVVMKACSTLGDYGLGTQVHGLAVRTGNDCNVVAGSALVDMYAKCRKLSESLRIFYEMPEKNWVSWSAVIAGCAQNDSFMDGLELFKEMQSSEVGVSQSTYASVFRSCAGLSDLRLGTQLHAHALKMNFGSDVIVSTATMDMYAKCNSMSDAQRLFDKLKNPNMQSHNSMIVGYARHERGVKALLVFHLLMSSSGLGFDEISLSGALSACASVGGFREGLQIHGLSIKSHFMSNVCVVNALIDMYAKCGAPEEAALVFDEMDRRDAVSWNAIIAAYEQNGKESETLALFVSMLSYGMEPDEFTFGSVLKACAGFSLNYGMQIHGRVIKSGKSFNFFLGSSLVDMYSKCGTIEEAKKVHDRMDDHIAVSWNAMISGFSMQKQGEVAQRVFNQMLEMGVKPDNFTYATVLDTCANLASIGLGRQMHAQIIKQEFQSDVYICSALVDMYSKCGNMQDSRLVFGKATNRDYVTWNAMICGYSHHGPGEEALRMFENMKLENMAPNHATFISLLRACAHMGLIEKGQHYFSSMQSEYALEPQLEHYSCMVDILGRSGKVSEAFKLIREMPFQADDVIWRTLLSVCSIHGNVEVAEEAVRSILWLDPQDSSAYITLSNIYADAGMWNKVSELRRIMMHNKLKKEPGCSWIEIKDAVHIFIVGDKAHPRCKEIYNELASLHEEMKLDNDELVIDFLSEQEGEENQQQEEYELCMSV